MNELPCWNVAEARDGEPQKFNHRKNRVVVRLGSKLVRRKGSFEEHVEYCQDHDPEFGDDKLARTENTATR